MDGADERLRGGTRHRREVFAREFDVDQARFPIHIPVGVAQQMQGSRAVAVAK